MSIKTTDIIPMKDARARLTEIAEDARQGREKIITRNGESFVALIDARRLDHYHRLERELIHLTLIEEAKKGLQDARDGKVIGVAELRRKYGRD